MRVTTAALPGGHVLVTLAGEIDIATAPVVSQAIEEAVREATAGVVIDLGQVTFLGAAGLHVLAEASHTARHLPGRVRLRAVPPPVLRLLSLTGLRHRLPVTPAAGTPLTRRPLPSAAPRRARRRERGDYRDAAARLVTWPTTDSP